MTYGLPQRCALVVLAARGGEVANNAFGFTLTKPHRDKLEKDGLITIGKAGRTMTLRLTDKGWQTFEEEMTAEPPPRSGSAGAALYATLHAVGAMLARNRHHARDAFRSAGKPRSGGDEATPPKGGDGGGGQPAGGTVEERIAGAYRGLAAKPRAWVELVDLRNALDGFAREDVDSALLRMVSAKSIEMTVHEDRGSLTKAQREAALRVGRHDMHLVSVRTDP